MKKWSYEPQREKQKKRENWIGEQLKSEYEFFRPSMPNELSASYIVRKLRFEKVLKILNDEDLILIWHSLWGGFLIKYIGENWFPIKIKQLHLVSAVLDENWLREEDSDLGDFKYNQSIIPNLKEHCQQIFIYHSLDDPIVPHTHSEKIKSYLSEAKLILLDHREHFSKDESFQEIVDNIKNTL